MEPPRWNAFPSYSNSLLAPRELAPPNSNPSPPPRNLVAPARFLWHKPRTLFPPSQSRSLERFFPQLELFVPLAISPLLIRMFSSQLELCSSPSTFRTPHSNSPPPVRIFCSLPRDIASPLLYSSFFWPEVQYFILLCSAVHYTELFLLPSRSRPPKPNPFSPIRFLSLSEFGFPLTRIFPQTRSIFVSFDILPSLLKLLSL